MANNMEEWEKSEAKMADLIGRINMAWGDAHFWVYAIFVLLMRRDFFRAEAVFFTLRADSAQRDVTAALGKAVLQFTTPAGLDEELCKELNLLGALAEGRNDAIHAMWSYNFERNEPVVYRPSRPRLAAKPQGPPQTAS